MAADTLQKLIGGLQNRFILTFNKGSVSNMVAGALATRWRAAGSPPAGEIPTVAAVCDGDTVGGWKLPPLPGGGVKMYLAEINVAQSVLGQFLIFDRLSHMGGLVGNVITEQTVNLTIADAATQGRCLADGSGVLWGLQVYTALGATATTATVTYTNENNTTGRITTVTIPATMRVDSFWPILPNDDDKRIKSIQSIQLAASTGTAGNFGVTARARVAELPIDSTSKNFIGDYAAIALPELTGHECLELCMVCQTTSTGVLIGNAAIIRV